MKKRNRELMGQSQVFVSTATFGGADIETSFCDAVGDTILCQVTAGAPPQSCFAPGFSTGTYLVVRKPILNCIFFDKKKKKKTKTQKVLDIDAKTSFYSPIHANQIPRPKCMWQTATFGWFGSLLGQNSTSLYAVIEYQEFYSTPPTSPTNYIGYYAIDPKTFRPASQLTAWNILPANANVDIFFPSSM